ncbi:hypothetical protein ACFLVX_02350 [Chloroflexota bacterium]
MKNNGTIILGVALEMDCLEWKCFACSRLGEDYRLSCYEKGTWFFFVPNIMVKERDGDVKVMAMMECPRRELG